MSGIHRFLTTRRHHHHHHHRDSQRNEKALGILSQPHFRGFCAAEQPFEKDDDKKVKLLQRRVSQAGIIGFDDTHLLYALRSPNTQGDVDKALELLLLIEDSIACVVRPARPTTKLQGAVNRDSVTCYLDALLFAMFACQDGFEAMLYKSFDDQPRQKLVVTMRLWINMVRAGALVTTDITKDLQDAIATCGWAGAAELQQQDTSEAFIFITQTMELPLLTLKMDVFHPGKEDVNDDHKFVHERLLDIPIPPETGDGTPVTLEDCLEAYFNNRVEVKRLLDRRMTLSSTRSFDSVAKGAASHIETVEVASSNGTSPVRSSTPRLEEGTPLSSVRGFTDSPTSLMGPTRTNSLIRERFVPESEDRPVGNRQRSLSLSLYSPRGRRGTLRKEVMLPAWQFFSLIPWYTDNIPNDDAEVVAHFQSQRPMIGMCLKRYGVSPEGHPMRRDTYIDIPTEIGLPHFIQDDDLDERGRLFGEFKLSLQAFVCHQGTSADSGHYIAIVRRPVAATGEHDDADHGSADSSRYWLRFDDLAPERVTKVDVEKALRDESPYLLFWQILPMDDDTEEAGPLDKPPSYNSSDGPDRDAAAVAPLSHPLSWSAHEHQADKVDHARPARASFDIPIRDGHPPRSVAPVSRRPNSGVLDLPDTAYHAGTSSSLSEVGSPPLVTPGEDEGNRLSFAWSRRGSRAAKSASTSRAPSQGGEGRISATFARLTGRLSRDKIITDSSSSETEDDIVFVKEVVEAARHYRQAQAQQGQHAAHDKSNGIIDSREIFARFRSKDPETGKVKVKDKSAREKNGRRLERECVLM